jgi:hypothetical protein
MELKEPSQLARVRSHVNKNTRPWKKSARFQKIPRRSNGRENYFVTAVKNHSTE